MPCGKAGVVSEGNRPILLLVRVEGKSGVKRRTSPRRMSLFRRVVSKYTNAPKRLPRNDLGSGVSCCRIAFMNVIQPHNSLK